MEWDVPHYYFLLVFTREIGNLRDIFTFRRYVAVYLACTEIWVHSQCVIEIWMIFLMFNGMGTTVWAF